MGESPKRNYEFGSDVPPHIREFRRPKMQKITAIFDRENVDSIYYGTMEEMREYEENIERMRKLVAAGVMKDLDLSLPRAEIKVNLNELTIEDKKKVALKLLDYKDLLRFEKIYEKLERAEIKAITAKERLEQIQQGELTVSQAKKEAKKKRYLDLKLLKKSRDGNSTRHDDSCNKHMFDEPDPNSRRPEDCIDKKKMAELRKRNAKVFAHLDQVQEAERKRHPRYRNFLDQNRSNCPKRRWQDKECINSPPVIELFNATGQLISVNGIAVDHEGIRIYEEVVNKDKKILRLNQTRVKDMKHYDGDCVRDRNGALVSILGKPVREEIRNQAGKLLFVNGVAVDENEEELELAAKLIRNMDTNGHVKRNSIVSKLKPKTKTVKEKLLQEVEQQYMREERMLLEKAKKMESHLIEQEKEMKKAAKEENKDNAKKIEKDLLRLEKEKLADKQKSIRDKEKELLLNQKTTQLQKASERITKKAGLNNSLLKDSTTEAAVWAHKVYVECRSGDTDSDTSLESSDEEAKNDAHNAQVIANPSMQNLVTKDMEKLVLNINSKIEKHEKNMQKIDQEYEKKEKKMLEKFAIQEHKNKLNQLEKEDKDHAKKMKQQEKLLKERIKEKEKLVKTRQRTAKETQKEKEKGEKMLHALEHKQKMKEMKMNEREHEKNLKLQEKILKEKSKEIDRIENDRQKSHKEALKQKERHEKQQHQLQAKEKEIQNRMKENEEKLQLERMKQLKKQEEKDAASREKEIALLKKFQEKTLDRERRYEEKEKKFLDKQLQRENKEKLERIKLLQKQEQKQAKLRENEIADLEKQATKEQQKQIELLRKEEKLTLKESDKQAKAHLKALKEEHKQREMDTKAREQEIELLEKERGKMALEEFKKLQREGKAQEKQRQKDLKLQLKKKKEDQKLFANEARAKEREIANMEREQKRIAEKEASNAKREEKDLAKRTKKQLEEQMKKAKEEQRFKEKAAKDKLKEIEKIEKEQENIALKELENLRKDGKIAEKRIQQETREQLQKLKLANQKEAETSKKRIKEIEKLEEEEIKMAEKELERVKKEGKYKESEAEKETKAKLKKLKVEQKQKEKESKERAKEVGKLEKLEKEIMLREAMMYTEAIKVMKMQEAVNRQKAAMKSKKEIESELQEIISTELDQETRKELQYIAKDINQVEAERSDIEGEKERLKAQEEGIEAKNEELHYEMEFLAERLPEEWKAKIEGIRRSCKEKQDEAQKLRENLQQLKEDCQENKQNEISVEEHLSILHETLPPEHLEKMQKLKSKKEGILQKLQETQAALNEHEARLNNIHEREGDVLEREDLVLDNETKDLTELKDIRAAREEYMENIKQIGVNMDLIRAEKKYLEEELRQIAVKKEQLINEEESDDVTEELQTLKSETGKHQESLEKCEEDMNELETQLKSENNKRKALEMKLEDLIEDNVSCKGQARLLDLKEEMRSIEKEKEEVKIDIEEFEYDETEYKKELEKVDGEYDKEVRKKLDQEGKKEYKRLQKQLKKEQNEIKKKEKQIEKAKKLQAKAKLEEETLNKKEEKILQKQLDKDAKEKLKQIKAEKNLQKKLEKQKEREEEKLLEKEAKAKKKEAELREKEEKILEKKLKKESAEKAKQLKRQEKEKAKEDKKLAKEIKALEKAKGKEEKKKKDREKGAKTRADDRLQKLEKEQDEYRKQKQKLDEELQNLQEKIIKKEEHTKDNRDLEENEQHEEVDVSKRQSSENSSDILVIDEPKRPSSNRSITDSDSDTEAEKSESTRQDSDTDDDEFTSAIESDDKHSDNEHNTSDEEDEDENENGTDEEGEIVNTSEKIKKDKKTGKNLKDNSDQSKKKNFIKEKVKTMKKELKQAAKEREREKEKLKDLQKKEKEELKQQKVEQKMEMQLQKEKEKHEKDLRKITDKHANELKKKFHKEQKEQMKLEKKQMKESMKKEMKSKNVFGEMTGILGKEMGKIIDSAMNNDSKKSDKDQKSDKNDNASEKINSELYKVLLTDPKMFIEDGENDQNKSVITELTRNMLLKKMENVDKNNICLKNEIQVLRFALGSCEEKANAQIAEYQTRIDTAETTIRQLESYRDNTDMLVNQINALHQQLHVMVTPLEYEKLKERNNSLNRRVMNFKWQTNSLIRERNSLQEENQVLNDQLKMEKDNHASEIERSEDNLRQSENYRSKLIALEKKFELHCKQSLNEQRRVLFEYGYKLKSNNTHTTNSMEVHDMNDRLLKLELKLKDRDEKINKFGSLERREEQIQDMMSEVAIQMNRMQEVSERHKKQNKTAHERYEAIAEKSLKNRIQEYQVALQAPSRIHYKDSQELQKQNSDLKNRIEALNLLVEQKEELIKMLASNNCQHPNTLPLCIPPDHPSVTRNCQYCTYAPNMIPTPPRLVHNLVTRTPIDSIRPAVDGAVQTVLGSNRPGIQSQIIKNPNVKDFQPNRKSGRFLDTFLDHVRRHKFQVKEMNRAVKIFTKEVFEKFKESHKKIGPTVVERLAVNVSKMADELRKNTEELDVHELERLTMGLMPSCCTGNKVTKTSRETNPSFDAEVEEMREEFKIRQLKMEDTIDHLQAQIEKLNEKACEDQDYIKEVNEKLSSSRKAKIKIQKANVEMKNANNNLKQTSDYLRQENKDLRQANDEIRAEFAQKESAQNSENVITRDKRFYTTDMPPLSQTKKYITGSTTENPDEEKTTTPHTFDKGLQVCLHTISDDGDGVKKDTEQIETIMQENKELKKQVADADLELGYLQDRNEVLEEYYDENSKKPNEVIILQNQNKELQDEVEKLKRELDFARQEKIINKNDVSTATSEMKIGECNNCNSGEEHLCYTGSCETDNSNMGIENETVKNIQTSVTPRMKLEIPEWMIWDKKEEVVEELEPEEEDGIIEDTPMHVPKYGRRSQQQKHVPDTDAAGKNRQQFLLF